ncbi:MAG: class I SAM-dependent methyltransferase [Planctomycetaceae bacterium]
MSATDRRRWDEKYRAGDSPECVQPDDWLVHNASQQPPGRALELACGLGHNAIWLAQRGWTVEALDVSPAGLRLASALARRVDAPPVNWVAADLDDFSPAENRYDLAVVFRFLDRDRVPGLIENALRPGGRLIYETFLRAHCDRADNHLRTAAFTLQPGELPELFPDMIVDEYRETTLPERTVAQLVARKAD